jgi:hypothetical protein
VSCPGVVRAGRTLRNKAAEHLRRGIDDIRDAAAYVFRKDELMMERYPSLFVHRGRKAKSGKASQEETNGDHATTASDSPTNAEPSSINVPRSPGNNEAIAQQAQP